MQVELERASAAARYDIIAPPNLEPISRMGTVINRAFMGGVAGLMAGLGFATFKRFRARISAAMKATDERSLARIG